MKKTRRLWLALLLTVLVAALLAVGFTAAAQEPTIVSSGYAGAPNTTLIWVLDSEGTFTVSGEGPMSDHFLDTTPCWNVGYLVNRVVIEPGCTRIGELMFAPCEHLETVIIPDTVLSVGDCAFGTLSPLTDVYFNGSEAQWNAITFEGDNTLLLNANIHYNVANWGYCGREGDGTNLMWVLTNDGTLTISGEGEMMDRDEGTPWNCDAVRKIVIENGVTTVGEYVFKNHSNLTSVTIADTVVRIRMYSFYQCTNLTELTLGSGLATINECAFDGCTQLESIEIPISLSSIGDAVFHGCTALRDVFYSGSEEQWNSMSIRNNGNDPLLNANIHYNVVDWGYCGAEGDGTNLMWVLTNDGTLTISGEGEMTLNSSMLRKHADEIQTVVIEEGATNIADDAFYDCRIMTGITIPDSVTSIGYEAFSGCWSLADITIPNTVTSIGDDAFEGCKSLTSIAIPESMTSISHSLFLACISLTDITIPNSVTSIGTDAFRACRSLTEITIPDSVTSIGAYAFQKCDSLRSIVIPNGLTSIGRYTFNDCSGLTEITIPDSVTGIGDTAFEKCNSLADVYYTGSEEQWNAITIEDRNTPLTEAAIHFNYHEHTPGNPFSENVVSATCTAAGSYDEVVYCTQCDYEFSRNHVTVAPLNHKNAQNAAATEATATEHGFTAGVYCPDCETWLSGHEVIHNRLGAQTVIKEPTATEEGLVDIVCTVCGETIRYTASTTGPAPDENGNTEGGFWQQITGFFRGFIDWFLRLFKWFGK